VFYFVNVLLKKLKIFLNWNSFLTTIGECSFKWLNTQHPHALLKLKYFVFILKHSFENNSYNKRNIDYGLTLLFMCSFYDMLCLQRPCPPIIWIFHDFNYHKNEREKPKTCLPNHKGSISHPITPLAINSLGGRHTHTHTHTHTRARTYTHMHTLQTKTILRNQLCASLWPARNWFNSASLIMQSIENCVDQLVTNMIYWYYDKSNYSLWIVNGN